MDFFTATTVAHDGHITTPSHGTLPAALAQTPAGAGEAVDAFAEAINARYSRASTLLIPLSPNQGPLTGPTLTTAVGGASASLTQTHNGQQDSQLDGPPRPPPPPILPALALPEKATKASFSLTMPARPAAPPLSLSAPPSAAAVPKLTLPSAPATAPLSSSSTSTSTQSTTPPVTAPAPATSTPASAAPAPASSFPPVLPSALAPILADASTLILDIRPHNAYALARLPTALSLSVPSTLLKRPLFSLARLAQMLASPTARARFSAYASYARIVVYDADSGVLAEGGNLLGLMRKFRKEGYGGEVCWVRGGFHAVWRERKECVVREPPVEEEEDEDEDAEEASATVGPLPSIEASSSHPTGANVLRTKHLPMAAFTSSSTTTRGFRLPQTPAATMSMSMSLSMPTIPPTPMATRADPFSALLPSRLSGLGSQKQQQMHAFPDASNSLPMPGPFGAQGQGRAQYSSVPAAAVQPASVPFNPFFDTVRQNLELGGAGAGEGIALKLPRRVRRRIGELPFEWLREIARRSGRVGSSEESLSGSTTVSADSDSESGEGGESESPAEGDVSTPAQAEEALQPSPNASTNDKEKNTANEKNTGNEKTEHEHEHNKHDHEHDGDDLARSLAVQFYKIELGEQRRLMGVMEHHSKESAAAQPVLVTAPARSASLGQPQTQAKGAGIGGGGVYGPIGSVGNVGMAGASRSEPAVNVVGGSKQKLMQKAERSEEGTERGENDKEDRRETAVAAVETAAKALFPFSITAGVEKGNKNRYRNIWPFEHTRVRLRKTKPDDDDYMNASYVQPLGTTKRYIATQGPLPATFTDFWTLVWEQNVHVIVMLTREVESALVKCGNYWAEGEYGPLRLKLVRTSDTPEQEKRRRESEMSGFFGAPLPSSSKSKSPSQPNGKGKEKDTTSQATIRRVFELTHTGYPHAPAREVTQLQYLDWPDLDVPRDPRGLLELMREVQEAAEGAREEGSRAWGEGPLGAKTKWLVGSPSSTVPPNTNSNTNTTAMQETQADHGKQGETVVEGGEWDEVDPVTGVARHAHDNAPVLLHCSAGVGRTGGFIAVDAILDGVRRELRKRREAKSGVRAGSGRSGSGSVSPREDAMEVDTTNTNPNSRSGSSSPSRVANVNVAAVTATTGLTMPVSVGGREVHVPVAGFTQPLPMDVDTDSGTEADRSRSVSMQPEAPAHVRPQFTMKPSSELISEVRRAQLSRMSSAARTETLGLKSPGGVSAGMGAVGAGANMGEMRPPARSEVSSGESSSHRSGFSTARSGSGSSPVSTSNSNTGSTTSLGLAMATKTAGLTLDAGASSSVAGTNQSSNDSKTTLRNSNSPQDQSDDRSQSQSQSQSQEGTQEPDSSTQDALSVSDARLDTWRSSVDGGVAVAPPEPVEAEDAGSPRSTTFDYTRPRDVHADKSPPLLSTYEEPIRRVVEDMREQRMSLCQSLRQYVFVHRAIIEGALMIVDAEKEREREEAMRMSETTTAANTSAGESESEKELEASEEESLMAISPRSLTPPTIPRADQPQGDRTQTSIATTKTGSVSVPESTPFIFGLESGKSPASALGAAFVQQKKEPVTPRKDFAMRDPPPLLSSSPLQASPRGHSKRQASPTELVHESRSGDPRLSKRPSVKRKSRSSDEDEGASRGADTHAHAHAHGEGALFGFEAMVLPPTKSASAGSAASGSGSR